MSITTVHVCVTDKYGVCADIERDWCVKCEACTVWSGEACSCCGQVWGEPLS